MTTNQNQSRWNTLQAVALVLVAACGIIFVEFIICLLLFDEARPSFGISTENGTKIAMVYGPMLVVTYSGLRDAVSAMIVKFDKDEVRWVSFSNKTATIWNYTLAVAGAAAPIISILLISTHHVRIAPEWLIGVSAAVWSLTAGDIFNKYLKQFSVRSPYVPIETRDSATESTKHGNSSE